MPQSHDAETPQPGSPQAGSPQAGSLQLVVQPVLQPVSQPPLQHLPFDLLLHDASICQNEARRLSVRIQGYLEPQPPTLLQQLSTPQLGSPQAGSPQAGSAQPVEQLPQPLQLP